MTLQSHARAAHHEFGARLSSMNDCPQCGSGMLAPVWSEHVNESCIRHLWACEACGYEFETSIHLAAT